MAFSLVFLRFFWEQIGPHSVHSIQWIDAWIQSLYAGLAWQGITWLASDAWANSAKFTIQ